MRSRPRFLVRPSYKSALYILPLLITSKGTSLPNALPITGHPVSTLATPSPVTRTESANGKAAVTAPPLITLTSTSTNARGSVATTTQIVAHPTSTFGGGNDTVVQRPSSVIANLVALFQFLIFDIDSSRSLVWLLESFWFSGLW